MEICRSLITVAHSATPADEQVRCEAARMLGAVEAEAGEDDPVTTAEREGGRGKEIDR